MPKLTPKEIVDQLLEFYADPNDKAAGKPGDPWRKGGHSKLKFKAKDFTGIRGGKMLEPGFDKEDDKEDDKPDGQAERFKWKPSSES